MLFERKKLAIIISTLCLSGPAALVAAQEQQQTPGATTQTDEPQKDAKTSVAKDESVGIELQKAVITGERTADEKGHDDVYDENITSVYQDREQLQRFQVTNPGDVFKGMNGVYSMDTRSSSAITPNIRGLSGEGRVPLTIDGTEQSTNVWLHMFGTGNRSYADPALFRSIEVEKGPSLSRGTKSGVGGAVNIRTIEPGDIIPDGDSWGIEANLRTSGNTSKPTHDPSSFFGQDYRDIPDAQRVNVTDIVLATQDPRSKGSSENLNFDNHSEMLAIAGRNNFMDILVSRSEQTSGNYYAGKNNANKYTGHDPFNYRSTAAYVPNLTKLYYAGDEIFNTNSETDTTLVKNNWYLPNEQKVGLQFMRTDMTFGETTPGDTVLAWALREGLEQADPDLDWSNQPRFVIEKPRSEMRIDSYKLSYDIKPVNSRWLNLETSLWRTETSGTRYQSGLHPYSISVDEQTAIQMQSVDYLLAQFPEYADFVQIPDHDGTIVAGGRQWTNHDRTGFDFSNLMWLSDNLQLTLGGSYQQEKLDDRVEQSGNQANGLFPDLNGIHMSTDYFGPRSGERKEYSGMFNLAWQPTNWLTLTAGARYLHYTGKDTGTAKRRAAGDEAFAAEKRLVGLELNYEELMTPEDKAEFASLKAGYQNALDAVDWDDASNLKTYDSIYHATGGDQNITITFPGGDAGVRDTAGELLSFLASRNANSYANRREETLLNSNGSVNTDDFENSLFGLFREGANEATSGNYWVKSVVLPSVDGKFDSSQNPFANGDLDATEVADNPYGEGDASVINGAYSTRVYQRLDEGQAWAMPEDQSGDAVSPVLSATARVTPYGTAFVRYAQTTRFPSIYELTSSSVVNRVEGTSAIDGASKPERNTNWEVGYSHDLTQFFPSLGFADVRLSYYNTKIKDFIDRTNRMEIIRFDQKKTSGIELQTRFDTGRYFGSLGATYRLEQKLCDKDYASGMDPYYNRIPECMTGGFPGTMTGYALQPEYSIDMALGTRLLNNRLELGWRGVYHSEAENSQLDSLLAREDAVSGPSGSPVYKIWNNQGVNSFYWRSVLLHDIYASFDVNDAVALNLGITNVTDEYYMDPMSKTLLPGPGRTVTAGLTINF